MTDQTPTPRPQPYARPELSEPFDGISDRIVAMTNDERMRVLARVSVHAPEAFDRAYRTVIESGPRRTDLEARAREQAFPAPLRPRPNVLPSGAWCAYAEDHGTDRWHEHDHASCADVQAEAEQEADPEQGRPWGSLSMDASPAERENELRRRAEQLVEQTHGCPTCQTTDHGPDECYDEDDEARADDYRQLDREQYEGNFDDYAPDVQRPQS